MIRCYRCRATLDDLRPDRDGVITCRCGARNGTTPSQRARLRDAKQTTLFHEETT